MTLRTLLKRLILTNLIIIITLIFFGCASPKLQPAVIEKPVMMKCPIPDIPKADIKPIPPNASYLEKLQIILNNYIQLYQENILLRESIKLCK